MKIDIFNHIMPQPYFDKMLEVAPDHKDLGMRVKNIPFLVDLDLRITLFEQFRDLFMKADTVFIGHRGAFVFNDRELAGDL